MAKLKHRSLESLVREYAADCPLDRFAAAYEFASMLDGYEPDVWRELATARQCHPVTGNPTT